MVDAKRIRRILVWPTKDIAKQADAGDRTSVRRIVVWPSEGDARENMHLEDEDITAPTITSANSWTVAENATLSHALTANETVTWSLNGGADVSLFELSGSTLRWASNGTKNFESPDDANADNAYVVTVRATDTANNTIDQTITISVSDAVEVPVNSVAPAITGNAYVGSTLTCSTGTWTGGGSQTYGYQWKSNGSNVGSNQNTYVPVSGDVGHTITCTVTATNSAGSGTPAASSVTASVIATPANTVAPAVTGNAYVGSTLTSSTGTWSGGGSLSYAYQWKSGGSNVGANQNTYVPVTGDIGSTITCTVTATNAAGSGTPTASAATASVIGTPVNTVLPAITGTATSGQTLSASTGTWTGGGSPSYAYQWKAGGSNIGGATANTFLLTDTQVGSAITCVVTATNAAGSDSATSLATANIAAQPLNRFDYDIDFVAATVKGGTQPYGNNTNDGRLFRDPSNIAACFAPNAAGLLVPITNAGIRRTDRGAWNYASATTRALWNRDLTNAAWVKTNVTAAKTATGADGTANASTRLTATADNGTVAQTITLASSTQVMGLDIKRVTGTGAVSISIDGSAFTALTLTSSYTLQSISQAAVTNPVITIKFATSGDVVDVDFIQAFTSANSMLVPNQCRVATTTATVLNSQSRPNADVSDSGPLGPLVKGAFAFYWQGRSERPTGAFIMTSDGGLQCNVQANGSGQLSITNAVGNSNVGGWRTGLSNLNKAAGFITAAGAVKFCLNGGNVGSATGGTLPTTLTHFDLFTNGAGSNSGYGLTERVAYAPSLTFTDAELIAMTT